MSYQKYTFSYSCEEYIHIQNKDWFNTIRYLVICVELFAFVHIVNACIYKCVRSCPTKTYYTLTNGKINSDQLYLSLHSESEHPKPKRTKLEKFLMVLLDQEQEKMVVLLKLLELNYKSMSLRNHWV